MAVTAYLQRAAMTPSAEQARLAPANELDRLDALQASWWAKASTATSTRRSAAGCRFSANSSRGKRRRVDVRRTPRAPSRVQQPP